MRPDHPNNQNVGRVRNPQERLKLTQEEAMREWRTLTAKRNAAWNRGEEFADDLRLRQVTASLNPLNL